MSARRAGVDLRGFKSPLGAVERKLGHELERAQADLAVLQAEALGLGEIRAALARERQAQLQDATALLAGGMDPAAYARCLQYLARMEREVERRSSQARALDARLADSRQACLQANRRLASLRALRDAGEAAFALEQSRRDARQADLAWLVRACGIRASAARPTGADE